MSLQKTLFFTILVLSTCYAHASVWDGPYNSARMLSAARTGVAATGRNLEDVFVLNPALLASKAHLSTFGSYTTGDDSLGQDQRQFSLGMLDSTMGTWDPASVGVQDFKVFPIASAFSYTQSKNKNYKDQLFTLGLAQAMSKRLAIGLIGNYSRAEHVTSTGKETFFDLGVGFVYRWGSRFSLGISAQNILDDRKEFPVPYMRRAFGAGLQLRLVEFAHLRLDAWNAKDEHDENKWVYRVALDNQFTDHFHFNVGFGRDNVLKTNIVATGFSIVGPRLSMNYGMQRETSKDNVLHSVDFHLPIW